MFAAAFLKGVDHLVTFHVMVTALVVMLTDSDVAFGFL